MPAAGESQSCRRVRTLESWTSHDLDDGPRLSTAPSPCWRLLIRWVILRCAAVRFIAFPCPARFTLVALAAICAWCALACRRAPSTPVLPPSDSSSGLYWGRFADVPEGMRVQVWLQSNGHLVRGAYFGVPYSGDIEGRVLDRDRLELTFYDHGITAAIGSRTRRTTLRWDARRSALAGPDGAGGEAELLRVGFPAPTLRPGLWMSRWTGLPAGMAVETRLTRLPDGRWRADYQYHGSGGVRDGSFEGDMDAAGVLTIRWTEHTESGNIATGRGRLSPGALGYRGTYGIEGHTEGTGEWTIEPLEP